MKKFSTKKQLGSDAAKRLNSFPSTFGREDKYPLQGRGSSCANNCELQMRERGEQNSFAKQTDTCHAELVSASCNRHGDKTLKRVQGDKAAFTLAEVLITLGIIGVAAALTIPSLIQKYEKQVTATRAKQAYSLISQAIKLSEIDNGRPEDWAVSNSEKGLLYTEAFLNKFILPYLKAEFCGDGIGEDILKKCGATVSVRGKNYFLANGTAVSFVPAGAHGGLINEEELKLSVMIDTNGPKKPNAMGKDQFYFAYYPNIGFKPYGAPANCSRIEILNGTCQFRGYTFGCKKVKYDDEDIRYRHGCTLLLMMDSWQIKDDYPW